jgi:TIR domain
VRERQETRLFVDRMELDVGSSWQQELFDALDASRRVMAVLTPAYIRSKICKEEFNIAWARNREGDTNILFPLYLFTAGLPTYMEVVQYVDCREGRRDCIASACARLSSQLR